MTMRVAALSSALAVALSLAGTAAALAAADDAAWIKRCVSDNADQNQPPTIIAAYCSCMNGKMSSDETLSITAWEKTHPVQRASCSAEAGWK